MKKVVFALIISFAISCGSEEDQPAPPANCSSATISFSADVLPIIRTSCTAGSCHASGSSLGPGALTNYTQIFAARNQVSASVSSGRMPVGSTLTADQKNKIVCWVQNGAPNN